ncbi:TIGR00730 family Rossman fold protein [Archangium gephyra]|uniref:TIGR00730 family Rossman fold protein n=1 Tax=Archangium gephyra TaxID=48 RepID=UPI0035D400BE
MIAPIPFQFPNQFRGLFERVESTYRPLLADALRKVHQIPIPAELRPFFDHITVESNQPSFMLVPLMFLAAAEASGGITQRHIDSLPTLLLCMEVTAVADDTVDRTPMRSGRMTFARRFGDASATPFTGALMALMTRQAGRCPAEFIEMTMSYLLELFSMFLWERQNTYPEPALFDRWLEHRYAETHVATAYAINTAFALNGRADLPAAAVKRFSAIFQDVDDIVGILERRDERGENDDLQMGIVTRPLLLTLASQPPLVQSVEQLWQYYYRLHRASLVDFQERHAELAERTRPIYERLRDAILEIGIPEAVRCMANDLRRCLEETPAQLRPFVRELAVSVADRLRRCERPDLDQLMDECFREQPAEETVITLPRRASRTICVYCSSSDVVEPAWFEVASALGATIGKRGDKLVFGGSNTGLMGAVARATHAQGGEVIGVIPQVMHGTPYVFEQAQELVVTHDLRARKAAMEARADAFVVLPGGFGTLDEALEIIAAKQMHMHRKPIVLVNAKGFWEPLVALFEHLFRERFASAQHHRHLYHLAEGPEDVYAYLESYVPPPFPAKWF